MASTKSTQLVGTRGSDLALTQSRRVIEGLRQQGLSVEEKIVVTKGDRDTRPFRELAGDGFFTRELEAELAEKNIQYAIHSAKDLPSLTHMDLPWRAVGERESVADVLVARPEIIKRLESAGFFSAHTGAVGMALKSQPVIRVGTSSPRRASQLKRTAEACGVLVEVVNLRGNVPTRVRKAESGELDAVLLAEAGLNRLAHMNLLQTVQARRLNWVTAPCQGILGLQSHREHLNSLTRVTDARLSQVAQIEKTLLALMGGGCHLALGSHFSYLNAATKTSARDGGVNASNSDCRYEFYVDTDGAVVEGRIEAKSAAEALQTAFAAVVAAPPKAERSVILTGLLQSALRPGRLIAEAGFRPLLWPLIESAPSFSPLKLQSIFADWKNFDAVVIASPMGARLFTLEVVAQLTEADANHRPQIFAVGAATAEALAPLGWNVRLVEGDAGVDQGLLKAKQVLFAGAAESLMVPRLKESGLKVTPLELYRTQASQHVLSEKCPVDLDSAEASMVIASPSAARELALRWRKAKPHGELGAGLDIWAIGPSTSKELDRLQIAHQVNPKSGSWKALIQAIV